MDDAYLSSALNAAKIFAASAKKVLNTEDGVHIALPGQPVVDAKLGAKLAVPYCAAVPLY